MKASVKASLMLLPTHVVMLMDQQPLIDISPQFIALFTPKFPLTVSRVIIAYVAHFIFIGQKLLISSLNYLVTGTQPPLQLLIQVIIHF